MKKLRIDYLMMAALVLGSGMAMATRTAPQPEDALVSQWQRVADDENDEGTWQPLLPNQPCVSSEKICKASFATGYQPNDHTEAENESAAISGSVTRGFVQQ